MPCWKFLCTISAYSVKNNPSQRSFKAEWQAAWASTRYKNSSEDEIANVNLFATTCISHTYFEIPKTKPTSFSKLDDSQLGKYCALSLAICNRWFLGPTRVVDANGISIVSAVLAGLTRWQTDWQTMLLSHSLSLWVPYYAVPLNNNNNNNNNNKTFVYHHGDQRCRGAGDGTDGLRKSYFF